MIALYIMGAVLCFAGIDLSRARRAQNFCLWLGLVCLWGAELWRAFE